MIPLKMTNYKLSQKWPSKVIIHHTACRIDAGEVSIDKSEFQTGKYNMLNYKIGLNKETGYHFIIEKIKNDYQVVVSQPLLTLCPYEDLDEIYWRSIHIAFMGNYDNDIPPVRLYKVLGYRVLAPLMRLFVLNEKDIVLHSTISNEKDQSCPGYFVNKEKIVTQLRSVMRKRSLAKSK